MTSAKEAREGTTSMSTTMPVGAQAVAPEPAASEAARAAVAAAGEAAATNEGWPLSDVTNAQAVKMLENANAGILPDISRRGYRVVKRTFDIVASGAAIVVLLIPGAILSAAICIKSPGAGPFYSQTRVGRLNSDGTYHLFRMWKFRSMVPDADARLASLKDLNEADGPLFKIKDDPRIIPGIGQFIRKHSIDELPQLLNVFVGNMSLIGPRPGLPREVVQYDDRARQRLTVKAGCGGSWQTRTRSDSSFDDMINCDLDYVRNCSVAYDIKLIGCTIKSMLTGEGAY